MLQDSSGYLPYSAHSTVQASEPLQIAVLNLMPAKQTTQRQICQLLDTGERPYQLEVFRAISPEAAEMEHPNWAQAQSLPTTAALQQRQFDALIITGAPVGQKSFESISYWRELQDVFDWSRSNVRSTLNICWAAAAALYHFHGLERSLSPAKFSGVYPQQIAKGRDPLLQGLSDGYLVPVSRYSYVPAEEVAGLPGVRVLAAHPQAGAGLAYDRGNRQVLSFNHPEYDADTLAREYQRDLKGGLSPALPVNYFPDNNPEIPSPPTWMVARQALGQGWMTMLVPQRAVLQPCQRLVHSL